MSMPQKDIYKTPPRPRAARLVIVCQSRRVHPCAPHSLFCCCSRPWRIAWYAPCPRRSQSTGGCSITTAMNCSPASQDFKGQLHCERAFQITVVAFGIVGFIVGYLQQEFRLTFYFLATGGGISAVVRAHTDCELSFPCPAFPHARADRTVRAHLTVPIRALPIGSSACQIGPGGTGIHSSGGRRLMRRRMRRSSKRRSWRRPRRRRRRRRTRRRRIRTKVNEDEGSFSLSISQMYRRTKWNRRERQCKPLSGFGYNIITHDPCRGGPYMNIHCQVDTV